MDMMSTLKNSLMEGFFPEGWNLDKIDECCSNHPQDAAVRQPFWNDDFELIPTQSLSDFDVYMGHEIAKTIKEYKDRGQLLALILPVGPMGMYKWAVYFLKDWNVDTSHVHCFNMDEWSDEEGNTIPAGGPGSFYSAMQQAFYGPLGKLTVPENQRNFATKDNLPLYPEKISELRDKNAGLVMVYGIGRVFHIAFWEPHFAADFASEDEWKRQPYRLGAKLHPLTIEQNALLSFKSRTTQVPCYANTIGPGLFLGVDKAIGGVEGIFGRGMQWQGMTFWVTLRYSPDIWVPSSYMPTLPGKLFYIEDIAGPLGA